MPTLKEADRYYKNKGDVDKVIRLQLVNDDEIVYGQRSVNKQVPDYLRKYTEDWDIATPDNPKQIARSIERALDKHYKGNFFKVEPAKHAGTFKVINLVTGKGVADVTLMDNWIDNVRIGRIHYATLDHQLKQIRKTLGDKTSSFRWGKDKDVRTRIKLAKSVKPSMKSVK